MTEHDYFGADNRTNRERMLAGDYYLTWATFVRLPG